MALCHLPSFSFSCASKKFRQWGIHSFPSFKILTVACSGSGNKSSRASKQLKATSTRPVKSNADLCNDIREFNSMAGLPENHVPSMRELCQHGRTGALIHRLPVQTLLSKINWLRGKYCLLLEAARKDLANIVRRRGYKLIAELLMNTTKMETKMVRNSVENQDAGNGCGKDSPEAQNKSTKEVVVDMSSSSKASMVENYFPHTNGVVPVNSDVQTTEKFESLVSSSLHKKAAAFIQKGDLETVEGTVEVEDMWMHFASDLGYDVSETSVADANKICAELKDECGVESLRPSQENLVSETIGSNADSNLNAGGVTSNEVAFPAKVHTSHRDNGFPSEGLNNVEFDKDLVDEAGKRDGQIEIDRLKAILHEKEIELFQLKQKIEKDKLALSNLQMKSKTEIGNAQRIISTKDAELHAVEESLSGLKEVWIEYWGTGEIVEVAGSFNGWHHPIKMDPNHSAEAVDQAGSRKSILWSTVLWLYPGIYEIKFIVDGHWRIDSQREFITRGNIQNNVLRVER